MINNSRSSVYYWKFAVRKGVTLIRGVGEGWAASCRCHEFSIHWSFRTSYLRSRNICWTSHGVWIIPPALCVFFAVTTINILVGKRAGRQEATVNMVALWLSEVWEVPVSLRCGNTRLCLNTWRIDSLIDWRTDTDYLAKDEVMGPGRF